MCVSVCVCVCVRERVPDRTNTIRASNHHLSFILSVALLCLSVSDMISHRRAQGNPSRVKAYIMQSVTHYMHSEGLDYREEYAFIWACVCLRALGSLESIKRAHSEFPRTHTQNPAGSTGCLGSVSVWVSVMWISCPEASRGRIMKVNILLFWLHFCFDVKAPWCFLVIFNGGEKM